MRLEWPLVMAVCLATGCATAGYREGYPYNYTYRQALGTVVWDACNAMGYTNGARLVRVDTNGVIWMVGDPHQANSCINKVADELGKGPTIDQILGH